VKRCGTGGAKVWCNFTGKTASPTMKGKKKKKREGLVTKFYGPVRVKGKKEKGPRLWVFGRGRGGGGEGEKGRLLITAGTRKKGDQTSKPRGEKTFIS